MGMSTVERSIDRSEIYVCDEAFLVGTGVQVASIVRVEHRPIGTGRMGPVVVRLRELYFDVVRGHNPKYRQWCTPVYVG
jgi:branched-chain amino acid aminotransferase